MDVPAGVLAGILARLDALENAPAPASEVTTPNYLSIDAQGNVSATFSGVITALGLFLRTGVSGLSAENIIKWTDASNAVFAQLDSFLDISGTSSMDIAATRPNAGNVTQRVLAFVGGAEQAELDLTTVSGSSAGTALVVRAIAPPKDGAGFLTLINGDGDSDYVLRSTAAHPAATPAVAVMKPVIVNRSGAYTGVVNWSEPAFNVFGGDGTDPQGCWQGASGWRAPALGFYRMDVMAAITNNTGGVIQFAVGESNVRNFAIDNVPNASNSVLWASMIYYMSANTFKIPGMYLSGVGGFGVAVNDAYSSFQRIA